MAVKATKHTFLKRSNTNLLPKLNISKIKSNLCTTKTPTQPKNTQTI